MTPFSIFAPAKINLALPVLGRRADGYHDLDSIVAFADVGDELAITPSAQFAITASGPFASDLPSTEDNIIARAWTKMRGLLPDLPHVAVHLTKNLPVASGIGGGSANAAAAIRAALRLAGIAHVSPEVVAAALSLGADVPVCLLGKACRMQGVGERMTPLENFRPLHAVLVNPGIAVSTADVFRNLGLDKGQHFGTPIGDSATWRNDLTAPATALAPVIGEVMTALRLSYSSPRARHLPHPAGGEGKVCGEGKVTPFVGMSGSGATCAGLFPDEAAATAAAATLRHLHLQWWVVKTLIA